MISLGGPGPGQGRHAFHPATSPAGCPVVGPLSGRSCPGDHERAARLRPGRRARWRATRSTKVDGQPGLPPARGRVHHARERGADPRAAGAGPHRAREDRPADEQRHRLAGDERVAEQRRGDGQPSAPEDEHQGAGQRAQQLPGGAEQEQRHRRTTCARAAVAAPRPRWRRASRCAAARPAARGRPSRTTGTPPRGHRRAAPPTTSSVARRARSANGGRPCSEGPGGMTAIGGGGCVEGVLGARGLRSTTVWCSVNSLVPSAPRGAAPGSTSVDRASGEVWATA